MKQDDDTRALISGYLDDELSAEQRAEVERRLGEDDAFREEFDKMKRIVSAASGLHVEDPPEEVWDTFLDGVYNRVERRTGWLVFIVGLVLLTAFGVYRFIVEPWGPALVKVLIATVVIGLAVLFISVLRQRLHAAKTDRYSKEVHR